jgi:hypothetical protein
MTNNLRAELLSETVGVDGSYAGRFRAYGVEYEVSYINSMFVPRELTDTRKKPRWHLEAAVRLCQSAAYERVLTLGDEFQRKHKELYRGMAQQG